MISVPAVVETLPNRTEPSRASRILLWTIVGACAALLAWAALAEIDETAVAIGRVVPSRQLQVVGNLEGGVVQAILVRAGDRVVAGQVLVRLNPDSAGGDYGRMSATTQALAARLARLQGEARGRQPSFPAGVPAGMIAAEQSSYAARQSSLAAATAAEAAKADGASRQLAEAESALAVRTEARAQAEREVALLAPLVDKGIEPRISLDRGRSILAQAQAAEAGAAQTVRRARAAVNEARADLRSVTARFRSQSVEALAATRAEMTGQSATLPALQDRVARTTLRSPVTGIVNRVLINTVGGAVRPGEPLVEVVPGDDTLVVEAQVRPADIAFVHAGQRAQVKLTAYDPSIYGALAGRVERISPDAVADPKTGESHFEVRVRTDRAALTGLDGAPLPVGVGMIAEVGIIGHKRTVLSYLLNPVTRLRDNAFREK